MKILYVIKKVDNDQHLLASLTKNSNGSYEFTPLIPSNELTPKLSFPLLKKAVESKPTQTEIRRWIGNYTPPLADKDLMKILLEKKGMTKYNEWDWLKTYKTSSMNPIGFYEEIPKGCIRHTNSSKVIPIDVLIEACDKLIRGNDEDYDITKALAPYIDEDTSFEEALAPYLDDDFEENYSKEFHSDMRDFLYEQIGKPEEPAPKKISAEEFVDMHSDAAVRDDKVIECIYKLLAQTTLSSFCGVMKNPRSVIAELQNSLCSDNPQAVCADKIQLSELINKFVEKTGFGKTENSKYKDSTAAVYTALIGACRFNCSTNEKKG